ncbi:MAG TPA: exonuclease domain-containing protein [Bacteroidales bacterium]|nr:exonuclease domain-containing protein [Bacteroidales bacterium]
MYAIVDIETTGGSARLEKVTEIAIYQHDGQQITGEFVSLVNPERNIPYYITNLTGITNEMVENAPRFFEIARKIVEYTEGRTFVAHNVRFDYTFLREEFKSLGFYFKRPLLDTVALSRKLIPGHTSYSLGNICKDLNIQINGRHRAAGDAFATVKLFEMLLAKDMQNDPCLRLLKKTKLSKLNPNLDTAKLEEIPEEPGVYYFYNEKHDLIYIGKSRNLQQRISTHLSNNTTNRAMEMRDLISDIDWETTGSELIALLKESYEIKTNKPVYNRAQRQSRFQWAIYRFTDSKGYINYRYGQTNSEEIPVSVFTSRGRVKARLEQMVEKFNLCQKLCGLYDTDGACFHQQVGMCKGACCGSEIASEYNERALKASDEFTFTMKNFFIIDKGRCTDERCAVKIMNGKYSGYGYININEIGFGLSAIHDCIITSFDNHDVHAILKQYLRSNKVEKIIEF